MTAIHLVGGSQPLFTKADWDYADIQRVYSAVEEVGVKEFGLSIYPNQIEIITAEQMLDAYASIGLPLMYQHWSFGKKFAREEALYRKGAQGLAYEIVINSDPCIVYIMEGNTLTMQTLVLAHAGMGHNHFFKNNEVFRQWTDAGGILDYLEFAKNYVAKCYEKHGDKAVERILDAAHALMDHGVDRYTRPKTLTTQKEEDRERARRLYEEQEYNDVFWHTLPARATTAKAKKEIEDRKQKLNLPEENILYFLEKYAPKLETWERELLRIVRKISQYFYPQRQTQLMNEGCACHVHYEIMNRLDQKGMLTAASMLEFLHSHTNVVFQPDFDHPRYNGINVYALGFAMMQDIQRICTGIDPDTKLSCTPEQLAEDREWFPDIARTGDPWGTLKDTWKYFRDESFIRQFLSPRLMRKFRLFQVRDREDESHIVVESIHNQEGYRSIRNSLADAYELSRREPNIQIVDVDLDGDRRLKLQHHIANGVMLHQKDASSVLDHLALLWGYPVELSEVTQDGESKKSHVAPLS